MNTCTLLSASLLAWPLVSLRAAPLGYVAPRQSAEIAASRWGVQSGDNERVTLFARAGELGVKWTRFLAVWPVIEREKGRYDFSSLDEPVDDARSHGITPFVCLSNGHELYSGTLPHPEYPQTKSPITGPRPDWRFAILPLPTTAIP